MEPFADEDPKQPLDGAEQLLAARQQLRRIALCFIIIIALMPVMMLGGVWSALLLVQLGAAVIAVCASLQLRAVGRQGR